MVANFISQTLFFSPFISSKTSMLITWVQ